MTTSAGWDFDYAPLCAGASDDSSPVNDIVLSTEDDVDPASIAEVLSAELGNIDITPLFASHPVFWTRIRASNPIDRRQLASVLQSRGIGVRYVVSSRHGSQQPAPRLSVETAKPRRASDWKIRSSTQGPEPTVPWRWFLRAAGVNIERSACGTGAGTRLAVIDNDGRDLDKVDLDAEILVGVDAVPRAGAHAALMVGWAVGARTDGVAFRGVAPDASPRLYCIPKSVDDIFSLPLAIVRAVEDGADVIVCATYVEGQTSALLDDALEFAAYLGRSGRGTPVVMPTGREMSSPADSRHSSLSLGMGEPASDPRVFCIGPGARNRGWFLWRDRHGKMRPFANRGPALRWLAPGDDLAYPFTTDDRPCHAESSGASAVASGVLLLLLGQNPALTVRDIDEILLETAATVETAAVPTSELADPADVLPEGCDSDGHNAKHGYGRLDASAACLAAADVVTAAFVRVGEVRAARKYALHTPARPYSTELARWAARVFLHDPVLRHEACALVRATRLYCRRPQRAVSQNVGHLLRHLTLVVRLLLRSRPPADLAQELTALDARLQAYFLHDTKARTAERKLLAFVGEMYVDGGALKPVPLPIDGPPETRGRVTGNVLSMRESAQR
ncbi:MAG TPA: S8 family serine peptidase [Polyangiaceae bacterium]